MKNQAKFSHSSAAYRRQCGARLLSVCLLALGAVLLGWFSSAAQDQAVATIAQEANNQPEQRSAQTEQRFAELLTKTKGGRKVAVIVKLRLPVAHQAEGKLSSVRRQAQRNSIAQAQAALLGRVPSLAAESVKRFKYIPYVALEVDAAALEQLRNSPEVVHIQEDRAEPPALVDSTRLVGADAVWAAGSTGAGQTIAVLDTGVDGGNPFLAGKVVSEACFSINSGTDIQSFCPGGVTNSTAAGSGANCNGVPGCDHGTHVAGIAAGRNGTTSDGRVFSGVARDANIIAIQVFSRFNLAADCGDDPAPCVRTRQSSQISGLERVHDLAQLTDGSGNPLFRIAAVNMSLGGGNNTSNCDTDARKAAIDDLRALDIATVIAAGNDDLTNATGAPACISTAISVGSTTKNDAVSGFSNNAAFVSLLAPGSSIESSVPGTGFGFKNGTSMAAPHVAGAWAVYKSAPGHGADTVAAVLTQFQNTGVPILDTRAADPSQHITRPRLRLERALGLASADVQLAKGAAPSPVVAGTQLTYTLNVVNHGPDAAANVAINDPLPLNTTFVSSAAPASWSCATPSVGLTGAINCTKPSVASGETATITIVVLVGAATADGTNLVNTAIISTSDFDPSAANNTATTTTQVVTRADLEVIAKVDAPDPVITNNPLTYTITLRNNGPSVATGVTLSDPLPSGALFNNCSASGGGLCGGAGQNRTVTFATLGVGATAIVTISTTANCALADNAAISNTATITAATTDPNAANNAATATTLAINPPPVITCPANFDATAATPGSTTAIVNYPAPTVTDNCPGATVVCTPASGSAFPLGATTVNCTATDSGGATASCSFVVTVWDVIIQDDENRDYILFNSFTGAYKFVHCGVDGFVMIGRGEVTREGCVTKLRDDTRVVGAAFDRCHIAPRNTGGAKIKRRQPDTTFVINDRDILNNAPTCP